MNGVSELSVLVVEMEAGARASQRELLTPRAGALFLRCLGQGFHVATMGAILTAESRFPWRL